MAEELSSVQCVLRTEFNPASLSGTYQPMNGTGFSDTAKIVQLYNGSTTVSIDISLDGINSHMFMPPLGTLIIDFQTNHYSAPNNAGTLNMRRGQILYGRTATNPTYLQMIGFR